MWCVLQVLQSVVWAAPGSRDGQTAADSCVQRDQQADASGGINNWSHSEFCSDPSLICVKNSIYLHSNLSAAARCVYSQFIQCILINSTLLIFFLFKQIQRTLLNG